MITIQLNGNKREMTPGATIASLVESMGLDPHSIVCEQNLSIVKRDEWREVSLQDGDVIELLHFIGGG